MTENEQKKQHKAEAQNAVTNKWLRFVIDYCISSYVSDSDAHAEDCLIISAIEAWRNWGREEQEQS